MKTTLAILSIAALISTACSRTDDLADAYGNFEVDETVISAQAAGEIMAFDIKEGEKYEEGQLVGYIDTIELHLLKPELEANIKTIASKKQNIATQIGVLKSQMSNLVREQKRVENLINSGAATTKQLDDITGQIDVVKQQVRNAKSQYAAIDHQILAIKAKLGQLNEKIRKSRIVNPVTGVVLAKLAEAHEFTGPGKPLYKIANLDKMDLRVFVAGSRLSSIKLGESYTVKIDGPDGTIIEYPGKVIWISDEAEFTPKTIQTKEERVDMVYAIKLRVKNDGRIKIGMPGEMWIDKVK